MPEQPYGNVPWPRSEQLAERMRTCRYGAVFFGLGLTRHGIAHANVEALLRLVTDLNAHTRFVARRMRIPGDVAGADSVLCWHTGYPFSVNLARGYPRYNPGEYTANQLLERSEVDAVLLVGSEGVAKLTPAARQTLANIPSIVLDYPTTECPWQPDVQFTTAIYGIHRPGTAYRMDEVPVPLQRILPSPLPADHEVLDAIRQALPTGTGVLVRPCKAMSYHQSRFRSANARAFTERSRLLCFAAPERSWESNRRLPRTAVGGQIGRTSSPSGTPFGRVVKC